MAMVETPHVAVVMLSGFRCDRCTHEWLPRNKTAMPVVCPKCKSPYWNKPRAAAQAPAEDQVSGKA